MSRCASGKEDGIRLGIVDNEVNDSTSVVKLQRIHRSFAFAAMDTSFYTGNLVVGVEGCQLVLTDGMEILENISTDPEAVVVEICPLCLAFFLLPNIMPIAKTTA